MLIISMILITIVMKGGVRSDLSVLVNSINPVLKVGQNFTFKCTVASELVYCKIRLPGKTHTYDLYENLPRNPEYWYEGEGLNSGQCGITIPKIRDEHNGLFHCYMGIAATAKEITGSTNVTVARAPQGLPELMMISSEPNVRILGAFVENVTITASCFVMKARPKVNLTWFFGDEKITSGVSEEIIEFPENMYTVNQSFIHKLSWRDDEKILRCEANPITSDLGPFSINRTIKVYFAPQPNNTIQKFSLVVGKDETIAVQIQANPCPVVTWYVDNETIHEGKQDSTLRFTASNVTELGNNTWETSLSISALTSNDIKRNYSLWASNAYGKQQYRVITTEVSRTDGGPCPPISEECLTCLCEASTNCDFNNLCNNNNNFCGPFSISYNFWYDGGTHFSNKSILSDEESWQTCARDPFCAAMTVRDYTKRYCKDCNGNGKVDCVDFALIHQLGGPSCDKQPPEDFSKFQRKLDNCLKEIME